MDDVTSYVGQIVDDEQTARLNRRVDSLGWRMVVESAGPGQQKIVAIIAPAEIELEAAEQQAMAA